MCGTKNHVGLAWINHSGELRPCTHCGERIGVLDAYQFAWSAAGPICFGLCRACYEALVNDAYQAASHG